MAKPADAERRGQLGEVQAGEVHCSRRSDQERGGGELGDEDRQDNMRLKAHRPDAEQAGVADEEPEVAIGLGGLAAHASKATPSQARLRIAVLLLAPVPRRPTGVYVPLLT